MADLTVGDKRKLEKLLNMQHGYVSNFSNPSITRFFQDVVGIDIYDAIYATGGDSKANRLRTFWSLASNDQVRTVMREMIEYVRSADSYNWNDDLGAECLQLLDKLQSANNLDLAAFTVNRQGDGFEMCAKEVREHIQNNKLREGLDRLHNFLTSYIRSLCVKAGIDTKDKSLNAIFGEYVKHLGQGGKLESGMTEQILKMSIAALERFNTVRNDQSLAHPNEILNYDESLLIFNYVAATVRFLESLDLN